MRYRERGAENTGAWPYAATPDTVATDRRTNIVRSPEKVEISGHDGAKTHFALGSTACIGSICPGDRAAFRGERKPAPLRDLKNCGRLSAQWRSGRQRRLARSEGADAEAEAAAFWKRTKRKITLITVQEILDEQHVQKM